MNKPAQPLSHLYGRRKGRPLRVNKTRLMKELLPQVEIKLPDKRIDLAELFNFKPSEVWLEIGFGGGEHLAAQAKNHPDIGFIGCEPFLNGVASLLEHIENNELKNIRVFPNDARVLMDTFPDASIARCFVLFADPWPKSRHAERRFIGPENMPRLARILKKSAELRLATDDKNLAEWMYECMNSAADFEETYHASTPPADWVPTRYEQKAIKAGRAPKYFSYRKR
jgi:tRNA (guanine-N7-)-methyltransferase